MRKKRDPRRKARKGHNAPLTSTVYVYHTFSGTYEQLRKLDDTVTERMYKQDKYFALPRETYPSISKFPKTKEKRGKKLCEAMRVEETYITKQKLPPKRKRLVGTHAATREDLEKLAHYLHYLFSSPSLCKENLLYDELGFEPELKELIRSLASNKLEALASSALLPCIRDPVKLKHKGESDFHTVYIVRRPLNDQSLSLLNFNHWSIKFEGKEQLMTTEFGYYNDRHGIIKTQILPNTPSHRRVFWYFWQKDPHDPHQKPQYFTERWECIETIYVGSINAGCVGHLICKWLRIHSNAKYSVTTNNCQHYARDLTAVLDIAAARRLNGLMDHRFVAAAIPAAALADGMSEEARTNEIYDVLIKAVKEYREAEANPKEENLADNWALIADQLGLGNEDNKSEDDDDDESKATEFFDSSNSQDIYNQCAMNHSNSTAVGPTPSNSLNNHNTVSHIVEEEEDK